MEYINLDKFDESGITTWESESGEVFYDLTELCTMLGVEVNSICTKVDGWRYGKRHGEEHIVVNEGLFFRAIFFIMESQRDMYASELLALSMALD